MHSTLVRIIQNPYQMKFMKIKTIYFLLTLLFVTLIHVQCQNNTSVKEYDVVVYGGTSAGIAAAIQAKRMGKSVILIEQTSRVGGLTTGGLGQTDIGNKAAIGGFSREFYEDIKSLEATEER
jgi:NADPH-dependent 2,4-dienoyl-CoA reductase/sulfur reductase-like enzyme